MLLRRRCSRVPHVLVSLAKGPSGRADLARKVAITSQVESHRGGSEDRIRASGRHHRRSTAHVGLCRPPGIARHRRRPGARPWQRAATVHAQVLLALRWLRHRADLHTLPRDSQISDATAYRYPHEALDVIASHAPDLHDVLARAHDEGLPYVCLDGTLIPTDRVAERVLVDGEPAHHLWFSGKHRIFGGNVPGHF